ncbi:unnamed protein product, partial [Vitis vinifera]
MPGNEVEDRICNFFEQDNSSQGHLQSQTVGGSWPVNYNQWVGNQRQIGEAINFNPKNFNVRQLDSVVGPGSESLQVSFDQNHAQVTLRPQFSKSYSRYQQLNSNGLMFGHQNLQTRQNQTEFLGENTCYQYNLTSKGLSNLQLQQKSASEDSPTLTTNSERSETAETPDFNFLGGQQHFIKSQQQVMPQPRPRQPSGFNDIQLVQQHIMFKQLQELQRQQQLQRLGDTKQNNSINQLSTLAKQASGGQFPPLINGTPIHDASQMFMNLVQRGAPPSVQGLPNRLPNTQEQGQAVRSMGLVPQQLDASLYGTPVASARSNMSPYTHLRGMSHDSTSFLANVSANQSQKPPMQPSAFSNPFLGIASQEQACMPDGTFIAKHGFQGRNLFGQIPIQDLNSGVISENFHQGNALQRNASVQELNGKQERTGWPGYSQEKVTQMNPSPGLSALDPMEEKILFNMDDNWDASFGKRTDMGTGSCGNAWEHTDYMNTYPSVNSGSWSALMQSAVAEASSSDTGLQEEWSGLTFQNTELSTDNQPSHFMDSAKQETGWRMRPDSSHESIQQSPKNAGRWLDCNSQQKQHMEGTQQMQSLTHLETAWGGQIFEQSESSSHRENVSSYNNGSQPCNKPKGGNFQSLSPSGNATLNMGSNENHVGNCWAGDINGAIYKERDPDGCLWKADGNRGASSFSNSTGGENVWLNASDPRTLAGSDQKSSGQVGWIASSSRRFLYHPMGNLGVSVEPADTLKHVTNPQVPCQQVSEGLTSREQGYLGQFQIVGNVSNSNMDMEKGNLPDFQGNLKAPEVPSGVSLRSNAFASSDRSGGFYSPNVTIPTSQNMLELLHKVDQTREDSTVTHFGTPDCNPLSRVPEPETPDVSVAQPYNSASQGFGLRLAPPSQRLPNSNHFFSSQGSSQAASNLKVRHVNPELPQKGQTWLASPSSMQSLPPHESSQTGCWDDKSMFTSGSPYLRNQLQKQLIPNAPVVRQTLQASSPGTAGRLPPFNLAPSQDTSRQIYANSFGQSFPVLEAVPVTQPSIMPGMSQLSGFSARPNNVWTNIPTQRHLSGTEPHNVPSSSLPSTDSSKRNLETPSLAPQELNDQNSQKGGNESLEFGALRYKENQSRATSERDFEAFGRSLKPSHTFHQNYFVHQTQAMRNVETDPSKKVSYPLDDELNAESRPRPFPTGEKTMVSFFSAAREDQNVKASSQPVFQDVSSQEMVTFGRQDSQSHSTSANLAPNPRDSSQINLQMAPSWFKQFGTLRNGQMLSMYDTRIAKTVAEQLASGKSSENLLVHASVGGVNAADASQVNSVWPSTAATLVESGHLTPPYMLPTDSIDQSLVDMGTKKRKIAFSELLPWHKEVTQDSQRLQNIRMAEREWAQTTNRLIEKVEYEAEVIEDRQPMVRPKRRLILTTQLMQQLLRPAPRAILSADATSDYDCVVYYIAKLALGDACGLSSCARSDLCSSLDNCNMMCEKLKSPERIGDQYFSKVVEGFTGRVKNLENELLRLDKAASILDIKVECQELEKFSVINRFARFHSRGQAGAAETSSASGAAGTVLKSVPQRYVTALPLPSKLPEGVQCLSL